MYVLSFLKDGFMALYWATMTLKAPLTNTSQWKTDSKAIIFVLQDVFTIDFNLVSKMARNTFDREIKQNQMKYKKEGSENTIWIEVF